MRTKMSSEADDIKTSGEAAKEYKNTILLLLQALRPVVSRLYPGSSFPDIGAFLKSGSTEKLMSTLTPGQKLVGAICWVETKNPVEFIKTFIEKTSIDNKKYWSIIQNQSLPALTKAEAVRELVSRMEFPSGGAQFLSSLLNDSKRLDPKEVNAIIGYFDNCVGYAEMYEELRAEEAK